MASALSAPQKGAGMTGREREGRRGREGGTRRAVQTVAARWSERPWSLRGLDGAASPAAGPRRRLVGAVVIALGAGSLPLAAQSAQSTTAIEVPLRVEGGRLAVTVTAADGAHLAFALTTGTPTTVLTESTARRLGTNGKVSVGGLEIPVGEAHTVPDAQLATPDGQLDGMIGGDVLSRHDVLLDVPGGRLVLKPVGPAVSWPGTALSDPKRLRIYHGVVIGLDVEVGGQPLPAMLDLGTPAVVVNEGARPQGVIGSDARTTVALGTVTLSDLPLLVRDLPIFERWDPDGRGFALIGAPIAWDCTIALSWAHAEMRTCVR